MTETPRVARSQSEYKRLTAQGSDVLPPINQGRVLPDADSLEYRMVAGERLSMTLREFKHRCCVRIQEEQDRTNPDNAAISLWCEAVRLARECEELYGKLEV